MGRIRVGLSGWSYDEWRGDFYPEELSRDEELNFVANRFDTVEVNGTFYGLTDPGSVRAWYEATPYDFVFAVKGSRYITHIKRLKGTESALANFFASGILDLDQKLGPILWQLPPNMRFEADRLESFLAALPHDTNAASELAQRHDDRIEDVSYGPGENHRIRHVLESRHETFLDPESARIARDHGVALAFSHSSEWPYLEEITAGFVYVRLHGPGEVYTSPYREGRLQRWAEKMVEWRDGGLPSNSERITDTKPPSRQSRDVYVYFDNTAEGHAPREANALTEMIRAR